MHLCCFCGSGKLILSMRVLFFLFSLDVVTSFWQRCSHVIVSLAGSLRGSVMLSRQARLHTACGGLTHNISSPSAPHPRPPTPLVCQRLFGLLS